MKELSTRIYQSKELLNIGIFLWLVVAPAMIWGQVVPAAGEVQCFQVGEGGVFTDHGGPGGNADVNGAPGNYENCDCVTTTTLCAPDGSAVSLELTDFGTFTPFDWLVILDGDNAAEEVFPLNIIDDPANADLQLFNNCDGSGDGGADNYGVGSEVGVGTYFELPFTSVTATNPTGCLTVVFRASSSVDDPGWDALISTATGVGHPGDNIACDEMLSCYAPAVITADTVGPFSLSVSWPATPGAVSYTVEYGPAGFTPGTGTTVTVTGTTLNVSDLNENTSYDFYIQADCGNGDLSGVNGPFTLTTDYEFPPTTCTYTLELFDTGNNGWNGNAIEITMDGVTTSYTLTSGNFGSFDIEVIDGAPIELTFIQGSFPWQVSYTLLDTDGFVLFQDGPSPSSGLVYEDIGFCPLCPAINPLTLDTITVGIDTAVITWAPNIFTAEGYLVEYGPAGFPVGEGLTVTTPEPPVTLYGLNTCVNYDVYVYAICGEDSLSQPVGPLTFMTDTDPSYPVPCVYTMEFFDSFGDGWNGNSLSVFVDGEETVYTLPFGSFGTFEFSVNSNQTIEFVYNNTGAFQFEVSYEIYDATGALIFSDGSPPTPGLVFTTTSPAFCPTCLGPENLQLVDVNADNAVVAWEEADSSGLYVLEYGPLGFTFGTGTILNPNGGTATMTGLEENTWYDVYLGYECDNGELVKRLGPLSFKTIWLVDVGIGAVTSPNPESCNLSANEMIEIGIQNFGQLPQTLIPFFYAVNGVPAGIPVPTDGLYTGVISNDSMEMIQFETTYDFSEPGYYLIEVWTALEGDSDFSNDTFTFELITALPLPLEEDFESGSFPGGWTGDGFLYGPFAHNNPTYVYADNNYSFDQNFTVTTERFGTLGASDTLSFDYRYVNWSSGTTATNLAGDNMQVQISVDCGETFETVYVIDSTNHVSTTEFTTVHIDLSAYEGEGITVRFFHTWNSGDYWTDLDNINISGCPADFFLTPAIQDASGLGVADGSISLDPLFGTAPFSFEWDGIGTFPNGTLSNITPGTYSVTVTDANGCTDQASYQVSYPVSTEEVALIEYVQLVPNPTTGLTQLNFALQDAADVRVQVFDAVGRLLIEQDAGTLREGSLELDLQDQAGGVYFVRVLAGEQMRLEKLILAK